MTALEFCDELLKRNALRQHLLQMAGLTDERRKELHELTVKNRLIKELQVFFRSADYTPEKSQ